MDIEFHYYMTYLIAVKGGYDPDRALTIAHAAQYIDNNDMIFEIDKGEASAYRNYISQTMNILKPKPTLLRIYPIFHFIPGDPRAKSAWRKDGKMHWLNTTPDSRNARKIMDKALAGGDLYRIGIACHGYVDTWAHQNFVGYYDGFNAMDDPLAKVVPDIGHADAQHNPDWPALVWQDRRLLGERERVDNKQRFLDAARCLHARFMKATTPRAGRAKIAAVWRKLRRDLDRAIGERDQTNERRDERIARYIELSRQPDYGGVELRVYDEDRWLHEAVDEDVRGLRDKSDSRLTRWDPFTDVYTWRDRRSYKQTDWYRFQEAVKTHQNETWEILAAANLQGLELPNL